ncbi:MAG TPA: 50S ribosomal protein L11 methyltransferase [Dehalococcoidia bacterium]|nr:50S ribosomal protein L11 methyltransferase [Dehalococcoidia bacterium]
MSNDQPVWTELTLRVPADGIEAAADILTELTGNGVTIEPTIEALGPDEGYVLDETAPLTLKGYVQGNVSAAALVWVIGDRLREAGFGEDVASGISQQTLREEDWAEAWKAHYKIEHVGRVVVRPAWIEYEAQPGDVVIGLDPGMAFGTGQHPTTRMCLLALQELLHPGDRVLDLGGGSGILAIAAVALGAGTPVIAIDTEDQAVRSTVTNAALNAMEARIDSREGSIEAAGGAVFDLVLANINAATLMRLAPQLYASLAPGAPLIAGGVIDLREAACLAALEAAGLRHERTLAEGDWRTFVLRRS